MKKICVLGLGYIGLPTASILAINGYQVSGIDVSHRVVETINSGNIHIEEPGLKTLVQAATNSGNLKAFVEPQQSDVFIIAVPTPINEEKCVDLTYIEKAAESILNVLEYGNLVILESTSPPGTTKDILLPILERSGLRAGKDFYVAHCPERVLPGKIIKELIQNNRVIGGINEISAEKAKEIYSTFVEGQIFLTEATTAEMVKLMENTFRDVNIALANETAKICHELGINAWDVINFANLHPRVNIHTPGPGVGGHCISVDPWFIVEKFPRTANLIRKSREINDSMPEFTANKVLEAVRNIRNPKITVLGVTYKADVDDIREAPSEKIIEILNEHPNVDVSIYDPHVKSYYNELSGFEEAFRDSDCIVIAVDHTEFKYIDPEKVSELMRNKIVFDTRNSLDKQKWERAGFEYVLLGCGKELELVALV